MACDGTQPEELAARLGISGKTLRAWLRREFPRRPGERGTNWYLTHHQVSIARGRFSQARGQGRALGSPRSGSTQAGPSRTGARHDSAVSAQVVAGSVGDIVKALLGPPKSVDQVRLSPERGGLPQKDGLYAWWATSGSIEGLPANPHPDPQSGLVLFYVGVAPNGPKSSSTIRSRVVNNHLSGNTGSSTFRFTLAALLLDELGLHPGKTATKIVLPTEENRLLTGWQRKHLSLTWCVTPQPWIREDEVIASMEPPLNLAGNANHPYYSTLKQAREVFRRTAG